VIIRRVTAILFCLALNLVWLTEAISQPYPMPNSAEAKSEIEQLDKQANELYQKKDYDAALSLLDRGLLRAEQAWGRDDPRVGDISFMIGGVFRAKKEDARAIPYFQRSLGIKEKFFGKDSPELTLVLVSLGLACKAEQLNTAAIEYYERCLAIQDKNPNRDNVMTSSLLENLANLYRFQANYDKALAALQRSQTIEEGLFGKESKQAVNCIHKRALVYADLGEYVKAESLFELGLQIREKTHLPEDGDFAICLRDFAHFAQRRGDVTKASALYQRAAKIVDQLPESEGRTIAGVLGSVAGFYRQQGDVASALALYQRCMAILEKQNDQQDPTFISVLSNLGCLKTDLGEYDEALALHKRSLAMAEKAHGKQSQEFATSLGDMASSYNEQGDFARALTLDEQSLDILEKLLGENHPEVAAILGNIGEVEISLGNYSDAMKHLQESLAIKEKVLGRQSLDVASSLNNLAALFGILGDWKNELSLYQESLATAEKLSGPESPLAAKLLGNVGMAYEHQGRHSEALPCYTRSLTMTEKIYGPEHPEIARLLNNVADMYQSMGDFAKAEDYYQRSLSKGVKLLGEGDPSVVTTANNLATLLYLREKTADAIATFGRVAQLRRANITSQLSQLSGHNAFSFLGRGFFEAEMLHSACAEAAQNNFAIATTVGAEQLALNKALLEETEATVAALEADPNTSTKTLRAKYAAVRNELAHLPESKLDPAEREVKRRELESELNQLENKLGKAVASVAQTIRERNLTLIDVARSLPPQSALMDFIQYRRYDFAANKWNEQHYAVYLTFPLARDSTDVVVERVDLGDATPIDEAIGVIAKRLSVAQYRAKDLPPAFQRLSDLVYRPLAKHLTNVSHLIICPDGQLSRLPFEMLPVSNKFLLEEKTISYVTSGREIVRLDAVQSKPKSGPEKPKFLVMGNPDFDLDLAKTSPPNSAVQLADATAQLRSLSRDCHGLKFKPLPNAAAEARSVAKLLGDESELRLGADAREGELKTVQSPRVLHLATHAFFLSDQEFKQMNLVGRNLAFAKLVSDGARPPNDWENPMVRCGVALAGANHAREITNATVEDGLLTGLEASLLNLQGTELVILSACDSGSGEVKIGEGVMSLRRAFRIAGAQTVLASHWSVSDKAASELMTEFMRRWRAGESRVNAWHNAQLTLLHSTDFSNPFFWAAFTLTGQW
jgi:CHAT domain-containing protein/tetratricopeptide (TPR) repeat protein